MGRQPGHHTDRSVRTVAPLASDPALQQAVADQITARVFVYLDVQGLTNQVVDGLAEQGVPSELADRRRGFAGLLANGIQRFVRAEVAKIVVKDLTRAQAAFNLFNTLGIWLPIIAIVLVGVWVAKGHRRALVDAAAVAYDTIVAYLRLGLRSVLVLALVVAFGALVSGPSPTAVGTRQRLTAAIGRLRGGGGGRVADRPGGAWVDANRSLLRIGAVTLAVLALVFWGQPTGRVVLLLAGLVLSPWPCSSSSASHPNPPPPPQPGPEPSSGASTPKRLNPCSSAGRREPSGAT